MSTLFNSVSGAAINFAKKHEEELRKHAEQTARDAIKGAITNVGNMFKPKAPVQGTYATGTVPDVSTQQMHFGMSHLRLADTLAKKKRNPRSRRTRRSKRRSGGRK